jgi:hypothetical protein
VHALIFWRDAARHHAARPGRPRLIAAGFLVTFSVRGLAIKLGSSLPVFRESATRERWKIERKPLRG